MERWNIGDRIEGRYEIHDIKYGGMGVVYICYDHEFKDPVAIKTFQDKYFTSKESIDRFMWEAETWVRLEKHKNIVRAYYVSNISDKPYIFLEFVPGDEIYGSDLTGWIWGNGLDLNTSLSFAIQFCLGMEHAERKFKEMGKPFVHRDIKPGNIMVTQDKVVKVTDFGLVKTFIGLERDINVETIKDNTTGAERYGFSKIGSICGTPPYMSPEQCKGEIEIDTRSDIYSLGCVIYEMLTGVPPFEGPHFDNYRAQHIKVEPRAPIELTSDIPHKLNALVMKCLEKEADKRCLNFKALREELSEIYFQQTQEKFKIEKTPQELKAWEWNFKGISLANLGKNQEAIVCYDRALEIDKRYTITWNNKGATLQRLGKPQEAIACYDRALEINPWYAMAWSAKGLALRKAGKHKEAIACCKKAIEINPARAELYYNMGILLGFLGKHQDAIAYFDSVLRINPRDIEAWYHKGVSLSILGKPQEAIACYDRALEINPRNAEAWNNKGNDLRYPGKYHEAVSCYDRALKLNPKYAEAWNNKGVSLGSLGELQEEIECYNKAVELNPEYADAWNNKGSALHNRGKFREAIVCYNKALKIKHSYADAWYNKGLAFHNLGESQEAIEAYLNFIKFAPAPYVKHVEEVKELVRQLGRGNLK